MMSDSDERPDAAAKPDGLAWPDGPYGATVADGGSDGGSDGVGSAGGDGLSGSSDPGTGGPPADRPGARGRRPFRPVHRTLPRDATPAGGDAADPYGATVVDAGSLADG